MLDKIFNFAKKEKKTETVELTVVHYTPKNRYLYEFVTSIKKLVAELRRTKQPELKLRADVLEKELKTYTDEIRAWEADISDANTEKLFVEQLKKAQQEGSTLKIRENLKIMFCGVNRMSLCVDSVLKLLKRGSVTNAQESHYVNAIWNSSDGLPSDVKVDTDMDVAINSAWYSSITNVVNTLRSYYPTAVLIEVRLELKNIEYGKPYPIKYQSLDKNTREAKNVTQTAYTSVLSTPTLKLKVELLGEKTTKFEISSGTRLAATAFASKLKNLANGVDRLTFEVGETVRSILGPDAVKGTIHEQLEAVFKNLEGKERDEVAQAKVETQSTEKETEVEEQLSSEQSNGEDSTTQNPEEDANRLNEEGSNDSLTTDGRDVNIVTP